MRQAFGKKVRFGQVFTAFANHKNPVFRREHPAIIIALYNHGHRRRAKCRLLRGDICKRANQHSSFADLVQQQIQ